MAREDDKRSALVGKSAGHRSEVREKTKGWYLTVLGKSTCGVIGYQSILINFGNDDVAMELKDTTRSKR
jgi:hypothetical protein